MTEFPDIKANYERITENIERAYALSGRNDEVRLMAVVKTVAAEKVRYGISLGLNLIGENRAGELLERAEQIDGYLTGCELHFIGGLQTNKVKYIIDKVSVIESVDSFRLIDEIHRRAEKAGRVIDVLLEVNIAGEDSKGGISPVETDIYMDYIRRYDSIRVKGLMTIPPVGESDIYFGRMRELYESVKDKYGFDTLSMGMSGDYEKAVKHGSNIVRIGSALFGNR